MATFGERFKMLRMEKGLNQEELIKEFNEKYHYSFTKSAVSQYENDKRIPEINALSDFADYFNITVDFLLGKSDVRNTHEDDFTQEELELLEKIKSDPEISILFHDLKSAPKKKIKQLLKTWEFIQQQFDEMEDEEE
ncbi:helix-turn-helix domain-containing protein [Gottschalkia purinilytica]|uniref:Helix-turn-helix domain-containing protein n=1 Tax=Gottschalkia purinilytica TaxID=1503 RepID=A0A0L0W9H6_GOTPU|nr:helix-turn-helix transcriptional regulator [Gottschalkia purinilytica]KNF08092.1 helix-turn-helix domain-containing protein [Gottschalkia purinilytica]